MQENHRVRLGFVQDSLPWAVAALGLLLYLVTLNRWVTLDSLPYVAKVTGWDWTLPYQTPLFFLVTYPFRWLPVSWQPMALNVFSAVCSALTLGLLARSVALLPHDRTHEQRQRERSEFSLLSISSAWVPPVLAALVCGLELTFWEHSTAATNESLDLLIFAYVIRSLLEFRITQEESWLTRMSFIYGLGVTNNFALIGFFPCVLVAVFWMKGASFFEFRFFVRMLGCGLLGLLLYLLLPLVWTFSDSSTVSFWQALRAHLASQKAMLLDAPDLRTRVLVLSLTSILPLLIMGIRWPATFGDTSAAGAALSTLMFRVIHTVFLAACIWVAFDKQFSPRALGFGVVPFLTFYYLGALSIGYFSGYLLLVFGESRSKSRHRSSGLQVLFNRLMVAAVWVTLFAVPAALIWQNWKSVRTTNGPLLSQFASLSAERLPRSNAMVLSDDAYGLLLLSATLSKETAQKNYLLVHTRSLISPDYHRQLHKRYPARWPNWFTNQPPDEIIDDGHLMQLMSMLSRSNQLYYLHPSFGYYFEQFDLRPHGLVYSLNRYATNAIFPAALDAAEKEENYGFWSRLDDRLKLLNTRKIDSRTLRYVSQYYSRALNYWGVALQRDRGLPEPKNYEEAGKYFQLAVALNTNNVPAESNFAFNRAKRTGQKDLPRESAKSIEDKFGIYRGWEPMMVDNGPFDHPDFCLRLGQIFGQQGLYRQSAIQLDRVQRLDPTNVLAQAALAEVYIKAQLPSPALEQIAKLRADPQLQPIPSDLDAELLRMEATAQFGLHKTAEAEAMLQGAMSRFPKHPGVLDTLLQIYAQTDRLPQALETAEQIIRADPDRVQSYINAATLYLNHKEPDKAIATMDRVLQRSPQQPQALLYKIFLLIQAKDYAKARAAIDSLLNVEPDNADALLYQAVVDIETKAYAPAIEPLDRALKIHPNDPNALRNRALAYLQLGDLAKARKDYDLLRRLPFRDIVYIAYYGLGEIAFRQNDAPTAVKFYSLYLQNAPDSDSAELKEERKMVSERLKKLQEPKR